MIALNQWRCLIKNSDARANSVLETVLRLSDKHVVDLYAGLEPEECLDVESLIADLITNNAVLLKHIHDTFTIRQLKANEVSFRSILVFLYAVALANALNSNDNDALRRILEKAVNKLCSPPNQVTVTLPPGDTGLEKLDSAFREQLRAGYDLGALWDTTRTLLGENLRQSHLALENASPDQSTPNVQLSVLGVKADDTGLLGTLTLEWLPDQENSRATEPRFQRHPDLLLGPCDKDFQDALDAALQWAKTSAPGPGVVRWNLSLGSAAIGSLTGNSMGAAFAVGLRLLWTREQGDKDIAITGKVEADGKIGTVAGIIPKLRAALVLENRIRDITLCLLPEEADILLAKRVTTLEEAVQQVLDQSRPRRKIREEIHNTSGTFPLPGKSESDQEFRREADPKADTSLHMALPLLKEIPKEKLEELERKRREAMGGRQDAPDTESTLRNRYALIRYEEYQALLESIDPPLPPEEALGRMTGKDSDSGGRMVILGPPGCGKTTLLNWVAWELTDANSPYQSGKKTFLPVPVRLKDWAAKAKRASDEVTTYLHLPDYLAACYQITEGPTADDWRQWLNDRHDVLLLLDGLDEAPTSILGHVKLELARYAKCPVVISCRYVSKGRMMDIGCDDNVPVYTPGPVSPDQRAAYVHNYPFTHRNDRSQILEDLDQSVYSLMVTNPLLLSILCFVADDKTRAPLPRTRTGLYEKAVYKLLIKLMPSQLKGAIPYGLEVAPGEKRDILERCALLIMERNLIGSDKADQPLSTTFKPEDMLEALRQAVNVEHPRLANDVPTLLEDFRLNSTLLMGQKDGDYGFLHLTFHEFLAASALARDAAKVRFEDIGDWSEDDWQLAFHHIDKEKSEWDNRSWQIEFGQETAKPSRLSPVEKLLANLDRRAWAPEWREVLLFLAGKLEDPLPLLQLLGDIKISRDDHFRHRLELAVFACREIEDLLPSNGTNHAPNS